MYVHSIKLHLSPLKKCQSQEGYNNFDLDLNDPELWAALEGSDISPLSDELSSKERRVAEVICYNS